MRGAGISEEVIVAAGGVASWKTNSCGLRTCWEKVVTERSETSCGGQDQPKQPGSPPVHLRKKGENGGRQR